MFKVKRFFLVAILIMILFSGNAYSSSSKMYLPIIVIRAGVGSSAASKFERIIYDSGIAVDWIIDLKDANLGVRYPPENSHKVTFGELESGKYKTAIFVFGILTTGLSTGGGPSIIPEDVIKDLQSKVAICKELGISTIGINLVDPFSDKPWNKVYTTNVIEAIAPMMDMLILKEDASELDELFLNIAIENNIEYKNIRYHSVRESLLFEAEMLSMLKEIFEL